jgi:hypothetical protein
LVSIAGEAEQKLTELAWIGRIFPEPHTMLQRNLLYTAITRAGKLCLLARSPCAISMGSATTRWLITVSRHWNGGWRKNKRRKSGGNMRIYSNILLQQLAVYGIINV